MDRPELERLVRLADMLEAMQKEAGALEVDPYEFEDEYCQALDEQGPLTIGGSEWEHSQVFREIDPTGYRVGLVDWVDGAYEVTDTQDYKDLEEKFDDLQLDAEALLNEAREYVTELEDEIEGLEEKTMEVEGVEGPEVMEELDREINRLTELKEEVEDMIIQVEWIEGASL